MSKAPSWLDKAAQNTTGNTVGNAAEVGQVRNKPGPKKSMVERKTVGLKFSEKCFAKVSEVHKNLHLCIQYIFLLPFLLKFTFFPPLHCQIIKIYFL